MSTKRQGPRVLVLGYYGFGNAGDEAILHVLLEDIAEVLSSNSVTVISGSPNETAADHGVDTVAWQDIAGLMTAAETTDLMVMGGGGLIQDYNGFDLRKMLTPWHGDVIWGEFGLLARMWNKPLAIYGIGVGPLTSSEGRRHAKLAIEQASAVAVRDPASLALLEELGIPKDQTVLAADPAFRLQPIASDGIESLLIMEGIPSGRFTIGVCIRTWRSGLPSIELAEAIDRLVEGLDARVVFLPFQSAPSRNENDAHAALEVMSRMQHADQAGIVRGAYGPREKLALFETFDLTVAMRLHAAMFGIKAGKPTVALAYDPKVTQLMAELGLTDLVLNIDGLTAQELVKHAELALDSWQHRLPVVNEALRRLNARSLLNRQVLQEAATANVVKHLDSEHFKNLAAIARARAEDSAAINSLRYQLTVASQNHNRLEAAYERLAVEHTDLMGSRAMRLARQYWKARDLGNRSIRRVRQQITGGGREQDRASTLPPPERVTDPPDYGGDEGLRRNYKLQLEEIISANPQVVGNVVLPHSIGWNTSLFQRPQQMALALARLGYLVFYGLDHVSREGTEGFRPAAPGVFLFSIEPPLLDVLKGIPNPLTLTYVYNYRFSRHLQDPITVFEHIDELEVFTATHPIEYLEHWYEDAISGADIVAASARDLLKRVQMRRPDAVLCQNGVDYYHFARHIPGEPPLDLLPALDPDRPIIGYYGALAEWVDYQLLEIAASRLPKFNFVFIGPNYDRSMESAVVFQRPNVWWLGPKEYAVLPNYLHHFSVATIPFVVNDVTHSVSPLKLFEYLAGGKPVVTTAMRESQQYDVIHSAATADEWVAALVEAELKGHDPQYVTRLKRLARANTWDQRVGTLIDAAARGHKLHSSAPR